MSSDRQREILHRKNTHLVYFLQVFNFTRGGKTGLTLSDLKIAPEL